MKNGYGVFEILTNMISIVFTKIFYKDARLLRLPIYIRGKKLFSFGKGFTTGYNCRLEMFPLKGDKSPKLIIGDNCKIGDNVHIASGEMVNIGDNCLFASKIYISDISHGEYSNHDKLSIPSIPPDKRPLITKPISIGDNVWLGESVCVLPGVNIGSGSIVGANSVVTNDIPENCIVAGVPARIIKKFDRKTSTWINKSNKA